ncbi:hypothetical protein DFH05DRAFT_546533 [Lentinula detonsa]|uniref:DUF7587 domain-containing protein n=1 Tax=Lentinula detonsa TaxID=2804962 RepID=A0A9W8TT86_9AGAR|nr:hypothetical protein DFH05DRAFT_546533 [Lentinula detonsa]
MSAAHVDDKGFAYTVDVAERSIFPDLRKIPRDRYKDMLIATPFLFRVHDELSHVKYSPTDGFIAREYVGESSKTIIDRLDEEIPSNFMAYGIQNSVKSHIRNFFKFQSPDTICPWISTTSQWTWAIGEAIKRKRGYEVKVDDVKVSVIDLRKLLEFEKSVTSNRRLVFYGMELLHLTEQMHDPRATEWTNHPQEILVFGMIPASTIINTISFESLGVPVPGTQLMSSPLPPWFFRGFVNSNGIAWEARRGAEWYSGLKGVRTILLQNFKHWAEEAHEHDGDISPLIETIASVAFRFAEFLVMPKGEFQMAIRMARLEARLLEVNAEGDALAKRLERMELMESSPSVDEFSGTVEKYLEVDGFSREKILKEVKGLWEKLIRMTTNIAVWGLENLDNTLWERLRAQILYNASTYAQKMDELELEVRKCEVAYHHHRYSTERSSAKLPTSLRPEFVLW